MVKISLLIGDFAIKGAEYNPSRGCYVIYEAKGFDTTYASAQEVLRMDNEHPIIIHYMDNKEDVFYDPQKQSGKKTLISKGRRVINE